MHSLGDGVICCILNKLQYVGMYSRYDIEVINAIMNNIKLIQLFIHFSNAYNLDTTTLGYHLDLTAL
jgi:hypothetical protein